MFLMCPLTLTSPSLCLLLIGHPWWLSHLVLKTVGCILSAQGPLGGYSSSSRLVLGGQGQSLCLSPCLSKLHTSQEFYFVRKSDAHLHWWGWSALLKSVKMILNRCLFHIYSHKRFCWMLNESCTLLLVFGFLFTPVKWLAWHGFACGVCPVAIKSTVYLLCTPLLLLPAHVCLRFWDRSLGPTDHTCGEWEFTMQTDSTFTKKREKGLGNKCLNTFLSRIFSWYLQFKK